MPRNVTALLGEETLAEQIPISLVQLDIPGNQMNMNDVDVVVYLNPSTIAFSMSRGAGLVAFTPYPGLTVPQVELNADHIAGDVSVTVSNVGEEWFDMLTANQFREAPATIWQGNLVLPTGNNYNSVTFRGAVKQWAGRVEAIDATRDSATITLSGLTSYFAMKFPYRIYTATDFLYLPKSGAKLKWGYTEEEI